MSEVNLVMAKMVELTRDSAVLCVDVLAANGDTYTAGVEVEEDTLNGGYTIHVQHVSWQGNAEGDAAGKVWEYLASDQDAEKRLVAVANNYNALVKPAWRAA